jgi:hypothetical protein
MPGGLYRRAPLEGHQGCDESCRPRCTHLLQFETFVAGPIGTVGVTDAGLVAFVV